MSRFESRARRYHRAIRGALLTEWDPIGVKGFPEAQSEYDAYVGAIYALLIERRPVSTLFDYLWWLETVHMGLSGDRQRTLQFAERLAHIPEEIDKLS